MSISQESISLKELLARLRAVVSESFDSLYWVRADISDLREDASRGHCYLELVEKKDGKLIEAKVRASIWAGTYRILKPYFFQETGQFLSTGMKVLVQVSLTFHEQFGLSCVIHDIDPTFTLGDIARKRQETIAQLKEDGVWDMNKSLDLPMLIQRIAVISSSSAAGYEDFCNQLRNSGRNYYYSTTLFPAVVQGEHAADSVVAALDRIYDRIEEFDVVVIIRGGGATTDLLAFDEYSIAASVAQFPLPVLTGIGHERDESVTDMVAHTRCKTPTAVAAFILDRTRSMEIVLEEMEDRLASSLQRRMEQESLRLTSDAEKLKRICQYQVKLTFQHLQMQKERLKSSFDSFSKRQKHGLEMMENTLRLLSPESLLKRGYSITVCDGKVVKSKKDVKVGSVLETIVTDGKITSKVEKI